MTIESTSRVVTVNNVQCRVWEGVSEKGVKVCAFICRVGVLEGQDMTEFNAELKEQKAPSAETLAIPLRMVI